MARKIRPPLVGLVAVIAILVAIVILWAVVALPPRLIDQGIKDPAQREAAANALRTTLAGIVGGLAVIFGALVAALNLVHNRRVLEETQRQNHAALEQSHAVLEETQRQNRAVLELQRRGQVTERFTRAIDQLGQRDDDKLDVRVGAVYALEQIARDSAELHWPIMEILTAFLREHASWARRASASWPDGPAADVQAILTVVGRRDPGRDPGGQHLDLRGLDLRSAKLGGARFARAWLGGGRLGAIVAVGGDRDLSTLLGANLRCADLRDADLAGALLGGTLLEGASLSGADLRRAVLSAARLECALLGDTRLQGAILDHANLEEAILDGAQLEGARLKSAILKGANLSEADLRGADLRGADLRGADLVGANLAGAVLVGADLRESGVRPAQLKSAEIDDSTLLPEDPWDTLWDATSRAQS